MPEDITKQTVLITGASGLLGRSIYSLFSSNPNYTVVGLSFSRTSGNLVKCDLLDPNQLSSIFTTHNPDLVIHAAAERRPDVCSNSQDEATRLNVDVTSQIASLSKQFNAKLICISTDYVFDGTSPPYEVDSTPNPLNFYGESKRAGEIAAIAEYPKTIILRVPILYGKTEWNGESAVNLLIDIVKGEKKVDMDGLQSR
jgi:S-adenosylmethionine synthetase